MEKRLVSICVCYVTNTRIKLNVVILTNKENLLEPGALQNCKIYHWNKTTKYDPNSGKEGLFADYINTFLKIKQEASGWPSWCTDENRKNDYIRSYMEKEKIQLDPEKNTA